MRPTAVEIARRTFKPSDILRDDIIVRWERANKLTLSRIPLLSRSTPPPPAPNRKLEWKNVCKSPSVQADRFQENVNWVYDTKQRVAIRQLVKDTLWKDHPLLNKMYITGVGGNGKSHNLALLVTELRAEGHVVVFIHDIERWIDRPSILLDELQFALEQHPELVEQSPSSMPSAAKQLKLPLRQALQEFKLSNKTSKKKKVNPAKPVGTSTALNALIEVVVDELGFLAPLARGGTSPEHPDVRFDQQKAVDELAPEQIVDEIGKTAMRPKLILVADQDNRLQRAVSVKRPKANAILVEALIEDMGFDVKILSASANNEGWIRRDWATRIEHLAEPVPADAAKVLFPTAHANDDLRRMLEDDGQLGGYPLLWGLAEKEAITANIAMQKGLECPKDKGTEPAAVVQFNAAVNSFITMKIDSFYQASFRWPIRRGRRRIVMRRFRNALHSRDGVQQEFRYYERNMLELHDVGGQWMLRAIFCRALKQLRSDYELKPNDFQLLSPALRYETAALNTLQTLVAVGTKYHLACTITTRSWLEKDDLPPLLTAKVLRTCPRAQYVDMYAIRTVMIQSEVHVELLVVQCTLNDYHSDSFFGFCKQSMPALNYVTVKDRCVSEIKAKYGDSCIVDVTFVWLTPAETLSLTHIKSNGVVWKMSTKKKNALASQQDDIALTKANTEDANKLKESNNDATSETFVPARNTLMFLLHEKLKASPPVQWRRLWSDCKELVFCVDEQRLWEIRCEFLQLAKPTE